MNNLLDPGFWGNPSRWPKYPRDLVFVCEAFQVVGRAMYEDWDEDTFRAVDRMGMDCNPLLARSLLGLKHIAADEVDAEHENVMSLNSLRKSRLTAVCDQIADWAMNGEIVSVRRAVGGGDFEHAETRIWNGDDYIKTIFYAGRVKEYFGSGWSPLATPVPSYIFFPRDDLEGLAAKLKNAPLVVATADLSEMPWPLRLAIKLVQLHPDMAKLSQKERAKLIEPFVKEIIGVKATGIVDAIAQVTGEPDVRKITQSLEQQAKSRA